MDGRYEFGRRTRYADEDLPLSVVDEQSSGPVVYSGDIILSSGGDLGLAQAKTLLYRQGPTSQLGNIEVTVGGNVKSWLDHDEPDPPQSGVGLIRQHQLHQSGAV